MGHFVLVAIFVSLYSRCESFRLHSFSPRVVRGTDLVNRKSLPRIPLSTKQRSDRFLVIVDGGGSSASLSPRDATEDPKAKTSLPSRVLLPFKRALLRVPRGLAKRLHFRSKRKNIDLQVGDEEVARPLEELPLVTNISSTKPVPSSGLPDARKRVSPVNSTRLTMSLDINNSNSIAQNMPNHTRIGRLWFSRNRSMVGWSDWSMSPTGNLLWLSTWTWPLIRACRDLALSGIVAGWNSMVGVCRPVWQQIVAPPLTRWYSARCEPYLEQFWKQKGEPRMDRLVRHYILPRMDKQSLVGLVMVAAAELSGREFDSATTRRALADTDIVASLGSQVAFALTAALNSTVANMTSYSDQFVRSSLDLVKLLEAFNTVDKNFSAGTASVVSGNWDFGLPSAAYGTNPGFDDLLATVKREWSDLSSGSNSSSRRGSRSKDGTRLLVTDNNQTRVLDALLAFDGSRESLNELIAEADKALPALGISNSSTLKAMLELDGTQAALDGITRTALDEIVVALEELVEPLKLNSIDGQLQRTFLNIVTESLKLVPLDYDNSSSINGTGSGSKELETWEKLMAVLDLWRKGLGGPSLQPSASNDVQRRSGYKNDRNVPLGSLPGALLPVDVVEDLRRRDATPWMQDIFNVSVALQAKGRAIDAKSTVENFTIVEKAEAWVDAVGDAILNAFQPMSSPEAAAEANLPKATTNSTPTNHVIDIVVNATSGVQPAISSWFQNIGSFTDGIVAGSWFGQVNKSSIDGTSTASTGTNSLTSNETTTTEVESKSTTP